METLITSGQRRQVARVVADAVLRGVDSALDEIESSGSTDKVRLQRVLASNTLSKVLGDLAKEKTADLLVKGVVGCLKLMYCASNVLGPTDGTGTIFEATEVFGRISPSCRNYEHCHKGVPTEATKIQLFNLVQDATCQEIFGSFGENLDRLCLTPHQIKRFCTGHPVFSDGRYSVVFLSKICGEFFVVEVGYSGEPGFHAKKLDVLMLGLHSYSYGHHVLHTRGDWVVVTPELL